MYTNLAPHPPGVPDHGFVPQPRARDPEDWAIYPREAEPSPLARIVRVLLVLLVAIFGLVLIPKACRPEETAAPISLNDQRWLDHAEELIRQRAFPEAERAILRITDPAARDDALVRLATAEAGSFSCGFLFAYCGKRAINTANQIGDPGKREQTLYVISNIARSHRQVEVAEQALCLVTQNC